MPTFGYALPVEDGWLVEETVLAARPAVDPDRLRPLLARRLEWSSDELDRRGRRVERVRIPMGVGPPRARPTSRLVAFGATAGMIHPATGYSLGHAVRQAPVVADVIARTLSEGRPARAVARAAYRAMWPKSRLYGRFLYQYGAQIVARFDAEMQAQFFRTFFHLPTSASSAYLSGDAGAFAVANAMWSVFLKASWPLRARLSTGSLPALTG